MKFYDYYTKPNLENPEELKQFLDFARKLDFSGIGLVKPEKMDMAKYSELIEKLRKETKDLDIVSVLEITKPSQLKTVMQTRKNFEAIAVKNLGLEANRQAVETEGIDILLCPYAPEYISFNYVSAKLARESGVRIGFSLKDLILADKKTRADLLKNMLEAARYAKRARCKTVFTTEAATQWDLRSHSELLSFGRVLGFQDPQIKEGFSGKFALENREKLESMR